MAVEISVGLKSNQALSQDTKLPVYLLQNSLVQRVKVQQSKAYFLPFFPS